MFQNGMGNTELNVLKLKNDDFNDQLYKQLLHVAPNLCYIEVKNITMNRFLEKMSRFKKLTAMSISLFPSKYFESFPMTIEKVKIKDNSTDPNLLLDTLRNFGNLTYLTLQNSIITGPVVIELLQFALEEIHFINCIESFPMEKITFRFFQVIFTPLRKLSIIDHWSPEPLKMLTIFKHVNNFEFKLQELNISQPPYDDYFFCELPHLKLTTFLLRNSSIPISRFTTSLPESSSITIIVNKSYDPFHKFWHEIAKTIMGNRNITIMMEKN